MPKLENWTEIEDGTVMGYVRTNKVGSICTFPICRVKVWIELNDDEAEQIAKESLWESGVVEWGY